MNKNMLLVVAGIAVLVLVGGGVWFMSKGNTESGSPAVVSPSPATSTENEPATDESSLEVDDALVKKFTVEGSGFKFSPSSITVKKGDTVQITFKNLGGEHDLVIDEFGVSTNRIGAGEEEVVEFVADKAGTFAYYCSVANHRAMGMEGTLVVE